MYLHLGTAAATAAVEYIVMLISLPSLYWSLVHLPLLQLYRPFRATAQDMCRFHTEDYINFLQGVTPQSVHEYTKNLSVFNVGDDWW